MVQFFHSRKFVEFQRAVFESDERGLVIDDVPNVWAEQTPMLNSGIGNVDPVRIWRHLLLVGDFSKQPDNDGAKINRDERGD